jgi:hypothetical protein
MEMGRRWTDGRLSVDIDQSSVPQPQPMMEPMTGARRGAAVGFVGCGPGRMSMT